MKLGLLILFKPSSDFYWPFQAVLVLWIIFVSMYFLYHVCLNYTRLSVPCSLVANGWTLGPLVFLSHSNILGCLFLAVLWQMVELLAPLCFCHIPIYWVVCSLQSRGQWLTSWRPCVLSHSNIMVSRGRCGTWLCRVLTFAFFFIFAHNNLMHRSRMFSQRGYNVLLLFLFIFFFSWWGKKGSKN